MASASLSSPYADGRTAAPQGRQQKGLALLLAADALLSLAPVVVLGAAIGWPASLGLPAAEQMALIHANAGAVQLGYGLYLLYSVLVAPVMIGVAAKALGGLGSATAATVAGFALLSALARCIGILRWLTVMPVLAAAHAAGDPATRAQIELVFTATTEYGGGVGELLGVSLFMAASLGLLGLAAWRRGAAAMPKALAASAIAVAILLAALFVPAIGLPEFMPIAAAVSALSLCMLAAAIWAWRSKA